MGTSGYKIFQDDFALDIKDHYTEKLFEGLSNEQATEELIIENQDADIDEHSVFWLSLAATQYEYGRLLENVKKKALEIIDSGEDLIKWNGDKKRAKELERLKIKLQSELPKEKKLVKRKIKTNSGDFFAFKTDSENYAFGRVLLEGYIAVYEFKCDINNLSIDEISQKEVAFVIGTTEGGFYNRKWKILGNMPLEPIFTKPIYFFHVPVMSKMCTVFNIWEHWDSNKEIPESECEKMN
ncbi:MAG: Imm26 family immunity protein [Bacteroidota bacterium]